MKSIKEPIGILGGSFDPPHNGHIKISKISLKKLDLKKLYWVITEKNPFKNKPYFNIYTRISKSKKLIKNLKKIEILFLDKKVRSSRTINIINYFLKIKKSRNLYLVIGSDNLIDFHKWTNWKKIVKMVKLVVFSRKGYVRKSKKSIVVKYLNPKNIIFINNKLINISSTDIKKKYKLI